MPVSLFTSARRFAVERLLRGHCFNQRPDPMGSASGEAPQWCNCAVRGALSSGPQLHRRLDNEHLRCVDPHWGPRAVEGLHVPDPRLHWKGLRALERSAPGPHAKPTYVLYWNLFFTLICRTVPFNQLIIVREFKDRFIGRIGIMWDLFKRFFRCSVFFSLSFSNIFVF